MSTVLFMMGTSRGGALNGILGAAARQFEACGIEVVGIDLLSPDFLQQLEKQIQQKQILFALGIIGIGRDMMVRNSEGNDQLLWDMVGIPFLSLNGDSPAYYFDRHVNPSSCFGTLYTFREHYEFRKTLPKADGLFGIAPPMLFDEVPKRAMDFSAKEKGALIFLKNGGDPKALRATWKKHCAPAVYGMLNELADILEGNLETDPNPVIDALVMAYFKNKGLDADGMARLRLFFTAQLDDYLRRFKCAFMVDVLKQFPVEIHGDNWEFADLSQSRAKLVPVCDYETSRGIIDAALGVIDFSPNTGGGFHDRPVRAFGRHTLCLTNEQACVEEVFGADCGFTFSFNRDHLSAKIADVLARPADYVAVGMTAAERFAECFPKEAAVTTYLEAAALLRLDSTKQNPRMADYFMWPPRYL